MIQQTVPRFSPPIRRSLIDSAVAVALLLPYHNSLPAQQMIFPGTAWQTATPESMLVDSQKVQAAVANLSKTTSSVHEMLITRNGRVIWEGANAQSPKHIWSATKTFAGTVLGLMVDDGRMTLDDKAKDYVPALAAEYPEATVRHFATNTSGYMAVDDHVNVGTLTPPPNPFAPETPLFSPPGSQFAYSHCGWDMLAEVVTRATGEPLEEVFRRRIAQPISMVSDELIWNEYIADDGTVVDGGEGWDNHGVVVSARNAARFGHLYLNRGNWDGQQLISSDWVDAATRVQVPASVPLHPKSEIGIGPGVYGLGWWAFPNWFEAWGYEDNHISVSPEGQFVVARLGTEPENVAWDSFRSQLFSATIPAFWDELGDGLWDEFRADTGKPRWKTETGLVPDIYPTSRAIVRANQVTVTHDVPICRLDIESGTVRVAEGGHLHSSSRIMVARNAAIAVDGTVNAYFLNASGKLDVAADGQLAATVLTLAENGLMSIRGIGYLGRFNLRGATARVLDAGHLYVDSLVQTGGYLEAAGSLDVANVQVTDGTLVLHEKRSPYAVNERFRLSGQSELRLVVDDESWDSPIVLAEGIAPEFSGTLSIDFAATVSPKILEGKSLNLFDWITQPVSTFAVVSAPTRVTLDVSQLYATGEVTLQSVRDSPVQAGDFDGNTILDSADIDALSARIRVESLDMYFDVNSDAHVTQLDLEQWVHTLRQTWFGDADLTGEFDSSDFVQVFQAGKYETAGDAGWDAGWSEGDWNGDGIFDSADFITAFQDGGYEQGPRTDVAVVPEPGSFVLISWGFLWLGTQRRWSRSRPKIADLLADGAVARHGSRSRLEIGPFRLAVPHLSRIGLCVTLLALHCGTGAAQTIQLTEASITDLNRALDAGTLTSERLVQLYVNRIAAYDDQGPELNSIITFNSEALATARTLDEER